MEAEMTNTTQPETQPHELVTRSTAPIDPGRASVAPERCASR